MQGHDNFQRRRVVRRILAGIVFVAIGAGAMWLVLSAPAGVGGAEDGATETGATETATEARLFLKPVISQEAPASSGEGSRRGLGFAVGRANGQTAILTVSHVVEACQVVSVLPVGREAPIEVKIAGLDTLNDIALLLAPEVDLHASEFSERDPPVPEGDVLYPSLDDNGRIKRGRVVALHGPSGDARLQTITGDGISRGDSGGPVLDQTGRLVGMMIGEATRNENGALSRMGFALKTEMLQLFLNAQGVPFSKSVSAGAIDRQALVRRMGGQLVLVLCTASPGRKLFDGQPETQEGAKERCIEKFPRDTAAQSACLRDNHRAFSRLVEMEREMEPGGFGKSALRVCYSRIRSVLQAVDYVEWLRCTEQQLNMTRPFQRQLTESP